MQHMMHGPLEDKLAETINSAIFGSDKGVVDPSSPGAKAKAEFYANVIAASGRKFVTSEEGKATIDKALSRLTIYGLLPGVLLGAALGWWLATRRKG